MSAEVVSLSGDVIDYPRWNNEALVAAEELLERVRSGEIVGVAIAGTTKDGCVYTRADGNLGLLAVGGLEKIKLHILRGCM